MLTYGSLQKKLDAALILHLELELVERDPCDGTMGWGHEDATVDRALGTLVGKSAVRADDGDPEALSTRHKAQARHITHERELLWLDFVL